MKKLALIAVVLAAVYFGGVERGFIPGQQQYADTSPRGGEQALAAAYENRRSDVQVQGSGRVSKVLADDNEGSRHQRFIVQLASGQTVLVAHNIDLASRVARSRPGTRSSSLASTNGMSGAASSTGRIAIRKASMRPVGSNMAAGRTNERAAGISHRRRE